ncbi:hypothetical protein RND81_08G020900 [Saponaria officinalis]|uniref:Uncharacterized protein n=1 Tax=Saponaria officinalis TaxID=3572 RepID=A0AAW1J2V0_SAPOF
MMYERQLTKSSLDERRNIVLNNKTIVNNIKDMNKINNNNNDNDNIISLCNKDIRKTRLKSSNNNEKDNSLEIIDLRGMSLGSIPNPNINLASISKLDLSNNDLQIIPESLTARLLNVIILDVHSNQLKSLPNSIGCLSKLKTLNVSGNLLTSLPRTIEDCRSLEEINANFNKLSTLPETIGFELQNLKKLSINSNKLVCLPYSLSHATNLRVLDVRLNCLRSLPKDLENLTNLQVLNISQNFQYLIELPYSIGLLLSLIELDVSYNNLTSLPTSIGCLRNLEKLCVEGNPLMCPPKEVIEQGLDAVRWYMSDKINGCCRDSPKKKSWFKQFKKNNTFNGRIRTTRDALGSPKFNIGMLSPTRFFSSPSRNYFSKIG